MGWSGRRALLPGILPALEEAGASLSRVSEGPGGVEKGESSSLFSVGPTLRTLRVPNKRKAPGAWTHRLTISCVIYLVVFIKVGTGHIAITFP